MSFNWSRDGKLEWGYFTQSQSIKQAGSVTVLRKSFSIEPDLRYGFSSNQLYGQVDFKWSNTLPCLRPLSAWEIEYDYQYNGREEYQWTVDAFYSFFLRQNYMKLFGQSLLGLVGTRWITDLLIIGTTYIIVGNYLMQTAIVFIINQSENTLPNQPESRNNWWFFCWSSGLKLVASIEWRPGIRYGIQTVENTL
jgi:hypothetical protein